MFCESKASHGWAGRWAPGACWVALVSGVGWDACPGCLGAGDSISLGERPPKALAFPGRRGACLPSGCPGGLCPGVGRHGGAGGVPRTKGALSRSGVQRGAQRLALPALQTPRARRAHGAAPPVLLPPPGALLKQPQPAQGAPIPSSYSRAIRHLGVPGLLCFTAVNDAAPANYPRQPSI